MEEESLVDRLIREYAPGTPGEAALKADVDNRARRVFRDNPEAKALMESLSRIRHGRGFLNISLDQRLDIFRDCRNLAKGIPPDSMKDVMSEDEWFIATLPFHPCRIIEGWW